VVEDVSAPWKRDWSGQHFMIQYQYCMAAEGTRAGLSATKSGICLTFFSHSSLAITAQRSTTTCAHPFRTIRFKLRI